MDIKGGNWDGKKWGELSTGNKIEALITIVLAIGIWVFGIIYVPLARMLVAGVGCIGLGHLILNKFPKSVLAIPAVLFLGAGYLLAGIAVIRWASWYMGFRIGY